MTDAEAREKLEKLKGKIVKTKIAWDKTIHSGACPVEDQACPVEDRDCPEPYLCDNCFAGSLLRTVLSDVLIPGKRLTDEEIRSDLDQLLRGYESAIRTIDHEENSSERAIGREEAVRNKLVPELVTKVISALASVLDEEVVDNIAQQLRREAFAESGAIISSWEESEGKDVWRSKVMPVLRKAAPIFAARANQAYAKGRKDAERTYLKDKQEAVEHGRKELLAEIDGCTYPFCEVKRNLGR